ISWSHPCFSTTSLCSFSCGFSSCCTSPGPSEPCPRHRCQSSLSASAPPSPNRLRASRTSPLVSCVSETPCMPNRLLRCPPLPWRRPTDVTSSHGGHLAALLYPCGLSLSRLVGAGQSAGQWPSQWRTVAPIPLYLVRGLFS